MIRPRKVTIVKKRKMTMTLGKQSVNPIICENIFSVFLHIRIIKT